MYGFAVPSALNAVGHLANPLSRLTSSEGLQ
jgi:hypothetical protein